MSPNDPVIVLRKVKEAFDTLGIVYLVGGSVASSVYGIPRFTRDVDFVAEVREEHASALVRALGDEFYADEEMIRAAVRQQGSFNVIFFENSFKADVFVAKRDAWATQEMARRQIADFGLGDETVMIYVASPEDVVLQKLLWYRLGGGVSDRQWNDVKAVLQVQAGALDDDYLNEWAVKLNLADLLAEARADAG